MNQHTIDAAWARPIRRFALVLGLVTLLFSGCLPHSCQRQANEALFPSDSLSRRVAQDTPADTLQRGAVLDADADTLSYPRTVRFLPEGAIAVSDVERNALFLFDDEGTLRREIADTAFAVPYLIGTRRDTLLVFNAESDRVDFVTDAGRHPSRAFSFERPAPETLVYMVATDSAVYAKVVGQKTGASIVRLTPSGRRRAETDLQGPYWRRAGFLRTWGNQVLSLSGYRPTVQTLPLDFGDGARPDSLSLIGFNSPMLERSYAYAQGDATKPPLLMASAVAVGDRLFVLNLRPGWVQIDVYGRDGRLQRRLVEGKKRGNRNFYPVDIDARPVPDGYEFAIAVRSPRPQVELFRWRPGTTVTAAESVSTQGRASEGSSERRARKDTSHAREGHDLSHDRGEENALRGH